MAKYKFIIKRIEYYSQAVVVDAENEEGAREKLEGAWLEDDLLYEKTTDCLDDADTGFISEGPATEEDIKLLLNIE